MSNLRRDLPLFFAYVAFSVVQGVALFFLRAHFGFKSPEYFLAYWFLFLVETVLFFCVIQEIYVRVLSEYEGLRKLSTLIFRWAFMVLALIAAVNMLSAISGRTQQWYGAILLLDRCATIVELGLIVLLFVFARSLALGWRECVFGIALGVCLVCSMEVVALTLRLEYGEAFARIHAFAKPLTWLIAMAIWTVYVFRSQRARQYAVVFRDAELEEWNEAVLRFLNR